MLNWCCGCHKSIHFFSFEERIEYKKTIKTKPLFLAILNMCIIIIKSDCYAICISLKDELILKLCHRMDNKYFQSCFQLPWPKAMHIHDLFVVKGLDGCFFYLFFMELLTITVLASFYNTCSIISASSSIWCWLFTFIFLFF